MSNRISTAILCLMCVVLVSVRSTAQNEKCDSDSCKNLTAWQGFNSFTLRAGAPDNPDYTLWQGSFDKDTNDIQVDVEETASGKVTKGKILVIGGRDMAIQGSIAEPGYEIDALDMPILQLQLVEKILSRVFPNGPASIRGSVEVDFIDKKTEIRVATPSAGGTIPVPWHVVGRVTILAPGVIQYQLTLISKKSGQNSATTSEGPVGKTI